MSVTNCIKCVAIGDGYVGKTSLLSRLANKDFDVEYDTTIFDNSSTEVDLNGKIYNLHLIDTAGQEDYELLRKQAYNQADLFLVCFSVTNMTSFSNVKQHWIPELRSYAENTPILLIGTKSDLRNDPETIDRMNMSSEIFVSKLAATNLAKSYSMKFIECSARTKENISEVLNSIVLIAERHRMNSKTIWCSWWMKNPAFTLLQRAFCCNRYSQHQYSL